MASFQKPKYFHSVCEDSQWSSFEFKPESMVLEIRNFWPTQFYLAGVDFNLNT